MDETFIITTAVTVVIGIIGYFLKRTMSQVDRHEVKLQECVSRRELEKSTTRIEEDIQAIKKEYLTKEDFIREMAQVTTKLDRIYDILLDQAKKG